MKVPLLDLKAQYAAIRDEVSAAMTAVVESQYFIMGPVVAGFEKACAAYCRTPYAIGVSSGTDALLLALMAENIGPGDEVITSPYTFFATAGSIARLGAKPVFVDIAPNTYNLNMSNLESQISNRTKAIIPVHLYGQCADMDGIMNVARRHKLVVIEDACQAIGSEWNGRRAGSIGDFGCFSFFPSKNLGGFGDGGLVTTNDPARAEKLAILRVHGMQPKYYHKFIGGNFRLDALQAAVLNVKLKHLDSWTEARQRNAARYDRHFTEAGLAGNPVGLPQVFAREVLVTADSGLRFQVSDRTPSSLDRTARHIFNQYVIRVPRRDELQKFLATQEIGTEVYYPVPLHLQECFAYLGHKPGDFPESERAAKETLALPVYPEVTDEQAAHVVDSIARFFRI